MLFLQPDQPHYKVRESQPTDLRPEDIVLRVDWQTLRRLPISQAIIFNFKALFTPLPQLRNERFVPRLLLQVLQGANPEIKDYKGTFHVEHVAIPSLKAWSREQEEKGWVPKDWEVKTLNDPFFPEWESPMS